LAIYPFRHSAHSKFLHWYAAHQSSLLEEDDSQTVEKMLYPLVILVVLFVTAASASTSSAWDMTNRFHGFRYEMNFASAEEAEPFVDEIKAYADENRCFGWVQAPRARACVGEVRCSKATGQAFQGWLERRGEESSATLDLRVYEDSKIRLHFTHFKHVDARRDTCFIDAPHRCATSIPSTEGADVSDEL
jgi:hypothetical protein